MDQFEQQFSTLLSQHHLDITPEQLSQFDTYYRLLVEWNERMNLTGITEREQVYVKHFYDSLSLSFYVPMPAIRNMVDVGSGAGFPSIPLKIMFPHLELTIIDSLNKRIQFLKFVSSELGLAKAEFIHSRAEDAARLPEHRDRYDLATARAVARLNVLNELCLPFVRSGGKFAAMKGADITEELQEAGASLRLLKAKLLEEHSFKLPVEEAMRHIVIIEKQGDTPKRFPRKAGLPLKQPLQ